MASNSASKKRFAISERQRKEVREKKRQEPILTQRDLAMWASREFGRPISQSRISESLSERYASLDDRTFARGTVGKARQRAAELPLLETALFEYIIRMEAANLPITSDMIRATASRLFRQMRDFDGISEPRWSDGWLAGFKKRFRIKSYLQAERRGGLCPHSTCRSLSFESSHSELAL